MGVSSGAHTALMAGITGDAEYLPEKYPQTTTEVDCIIDWFGPTDLMAASQYPSAIDHDSAQSPSGVLIGGKTLHDHPEDAYPANPVVHLHSNRKTPPVLIMHGGSDPLVPFNQSCILYEALKRMDKEVEFVKLRNAGLLDPGKTPAENTQFLVFLVAVIKAVDDYADLLRISVASAGNDHRLGANEAPPAVVSIFLGDELTEVLKAIENDEFFTGHGAVQMDIGAKVLPHFVKDNTDRNRTSPFAFTGNKFEFRMLGSSSSVANPNIILNTAVAEVLHQFYEELKDVPADKMDTAVHELLKKTIIDHKRVIFNGNGYTDEWIEEAETRGLYNLVSTPDALPHLIDEKNEKLLTSHHIFTDAELHTRYEIKLDNYVKTLHIEAGTLAEIIQKDLLPSITTYMEKIAQTAALKKSVVPDISVSAEASLLTQLTELSETMTKDLETLKKDTAMAEYETGKDLLKSAKLYQSVVLSDMEKVRASADAAEVLIPDSILPYPTYGKLLFSISD